MVTFLGTSKGKMENYRNEYQRELCFIDGYEKEKKNNFIKVPNEIFDKLCLEMDSEKAPKVFEINDKRFRFFSF